MAFIVTRPRPGPKPLLPAGALPFRRRLLSWYARHRRRLPWRGVRDPYAVLVSALMLQQTQVARVRDASAAEECAPGAAGVGAGRGTRAARAVGGLEPGADGPGGDVLHGAEAAVWRVSRAATLCRWGALGFVALGRSAGADGLFGARTAGSRTRTS